MAAKRKSNPYCATATAFDNVFGNEQVFETVQQVLSNLKNATGTDVFAKTGLSKVTVKLYKNERKTVLAEFQWGYKAQIKNVIEMYKNPEVLARYKSIARDTSAIALAGAEERQLADEAMQHLRPLTESLVKAGFKVFAPDWEVAWTGDSDVQSIIYIYKPTGLQLVSVADAVAYVTVGLSSRKLVPWMFELVSSSSKRIKLEPGIVDTSMRTNLGDHLRGLLERFIRAIPDRVEPKAYAEAEDEAEAEAEDEDEDDNDELVAVEDLFLGWEFIFSVESGEVVLSNKSPEIPNIPISSPADLKNAATYIALDGQPTNEERLGAMLKLKSATISSEQRVQIVPIMPNIELNVFAMFQSKGNRSMLYTFPLADNKHISFAEADVAEAAFFSVNGFTKACANTCSLIHEMFILGADLLSIPPDAVAPMHEEGSNADETDEDYLPEDNEMDDICSEDETEITQDETD